MAENPSNVVLNFTTNGQVEYAQTLTQINMVMQTAAKEYQSHIAAMGRDATMTEKLIAEKQKLDTQMNASSERVRMLRAQYEAMANDTNTTAEELQKMYNKLLTAETAHSRLEQSMQRVSEGLTTEAIAAREAQGALSELQASGRSLAAEQQQVISAFELEAAQLGANATEAQKLELAQRRLAAQTGLAGRAITNLESQLEQARTAYGDNSDEVRRLETQLNNARTTMTQFGDDMESVEDDSASAGDSLGKLGGAFQALGGIVAGLGLGAIIKSALAEADVAATIDITFNVPESSKESVRSALSDIKKYGVDGEAALEGMRRQWALNKDATDEMNTSIVEGSAALTRMYAGVDFVETIQEVNKIAKELETTNEEALELVYNLLDIGFPPDQIGIIAEYSNQFQRLGYTVKEVQGLFASAVATGSWDIGNLMDGLKEGRIKAIEFGNGISDAMKESIRAVKGGVKKMSEEQLSTMQEGFAKQESALSKSLASRAKSLSKSHDQQKNSLSKLLDNEYKAVSKNYDKQAKALEKSLTANHDKFAKKYTEEEKMLEKALSEQYNKVSKNYDEQQKALEKSLDTEMKAFEKATEQKLKLIDAEYYAKMKLVDEDRYNQLKALDGQIGALDAMTEAEDKAIKQRENAEKRAELNLRISTAETAEDRMSAMKDLSAFEEKVRLDAVREDRKKQIDAIKIQKDDIKELSDAKKEALQEEATNLKESIQEQSGIEKEALKERQDLEKEASKESIKESLAALSEENKATVEALKEQNKLKLTAISEANKAEMDAFKESSDAKLEVLKEQHNASKSALSERLSDEADAVRESHAAELESFKKMNAEKMEIAKNPPDSAAVQALFDQLEGWGKAVAKGGEEGTQAFEDMVMWLDSIEDSTTRNMIGTEMFGSVWEDQGENIIETVMGMDDAMKETAEGQKSLQDAMNNLDDTPTIQIKEAFESLKESFAPLLVEIAKIIGAFAQFAADNPTLTKIVVGLATAVTIAVGAFAALAPAFAAIPALIPMITGAFTAVSGVIATVTGALPAIGAALAALSGPIGIAIALIAGIGAAVYLVIDNWEVVSKFFVDLWDGILNIFKTVGKAITDFLKDNWKTILTVITGPIGVIVKLVKDNWGAIQKVTTDVFKAVAKFVSETWTTIKESISKPIELARDIVDKAIKAIKGFFDKLTLKFPKLDTDMFETARKAVKTAIDAIKGFFNFKFEWPELKMPKFSVEGSMNPLKWLDEGVPKFKVDWRAKGGIFTQPTIFGESNGRLQGAGEAGDEAVLPLNAKTLGDIGKGIVAAMGGNMGGGDINVTLELDGAVVARKTIKYTKRELLADKNSRREGLGKS